MSINFKDDVNLANKHNKPHFLPYTHCYCVYCKNTYTVFQRKWMQLSATIHDLMYNYTDFLFSQEKPKKTKHMIPKIGTQFKKKTVSSKMFPIRLCYYQTFRYKRIRYYGNFQNNLWKPTTIFRTYGHCNARFGLARQIKIVFQFNFLIKMRIPT